MQKVFNPLPVRRADNLERTDWFGPNDDPTIPGLYECSTMADDRGHVFQRRWDGEQWVNSVTGLPTKVRMHWRGVKPGTVEIGLYPSAVRVHLRDTVAPVVPNNESLWDTARPEMAATYR